ncbi:MAG: hypothetical protein JRJ19_06995 [Deltaproteobacteria bacterium]|nr:hypothetical protein [Deltaproteobacteria bacterium]
MVLLMLVFFTIGVSGCSSDTSSGNPDADGFADGITGDGNSDGQAGDDGGLDAADEPTDPCLNHNCPDDQHCEDDSGAAVCVNNNCVDLNCSATQECVETLGGGAVCEDIGCNSDLDCPLERFCNGTICVDDICTAGFRRCATDSVHECASNGSGFVARFTCGSPGYFESLCVDDGQGNAYCTCEDDWDCPEWMHCELGVCLGTGTEPTCRLPAEPMTNVLPTQEIVWGGTAADTTAVGSPFSAAGQIVMTPIVANLDDDNGDGFINESDFPEIIFLTFRISGEYTLNGILRAIHGGGPNKGDDFFAVCGSLTWHEGDDIDMACSYANADLDSTASLAVGDLDYDGVPEIVALSETVSGNDKINIYSNTGDLISSNTGGNMQGANPAPSLANVDNQGFAEIVIGRNIFTLEKNAEDKLVVLDRFEGDQTVGKNGQGPISCVANLVGDEKQEIVCGTVVYRMPNPPAGVTKQSECSGAEVDPDEVAFCNGQLIVVWDAEVVNGSVSQREGFCAVADVLGVDPYTAPGPDNPLDGWPEVLLIANGRLEIFAGSTGVMYRDIDIQNGARGGAPNVDDFDGDGFPELGTAFETRYVLYDFQEPTANCPDWPGVMQEGQPPPAENLPRTPGGVCSTDSDCVASEAVCNTQISQCVCLHNGWQSGTEDDSSRVTGSSVFDFNGDGGAEVIYNDECRFRIYNGLDGEILFSEPSESRTRVEYPIVADVDNDGNAEIVFGTSNESGFCSENLDSQYNNGLEVWGDAGDYWVSARRIWNQHSYHVTNIMEDGSIPIKEPESWKDFNGRIYNTYRSNPRSFNTAPDLILTAIQFSSPDATCGQLSLNLDITVQVENAGDLRVGPSLVIAFEGTWNDPALTEMLNDDLGLPLQYVLQNPLEPGDITLISVSYNAANNTPGSLPDIIRAIVDAQEQERECHEDNNDISAPVTPGVEAADLRIELGAINDNLCPDPTVETTVYNDGSLAASNILVRYYAGDPDQGGTALHEQVIPGPLAPNTSTTFTATIPNFPARLITVYAVVDPDDTIFECNDGDNKAAGDQIICYET